MKVVITVQDTDNGVRVTSVPTCRQMAEDAVRSRQKFTPAQEYAFKGMSEILKASKQLDKLAENNRIIRPGDGLFG